MLKKLTIQHFKSIYKQEIEFGKVNLFVGPNGSGKSNLLEALGVLSAALSSGLESSTLDHKGVRLSLPQLFKSAFRNQHIPSNFRLEAHFEHGRYDCSIRAGINSPLLEFSSEALYDGAGKVFGRSGHGIALHSVEKFVPGFNKKLVPNNRSVWSIIEPLVVISEDLRQELDEFAKFAIYAPQTAVMRGLAIDQRVVEPLGLTGSGLASAFSTLLKIGPERLHEILGIVWEPGWADHIRIRPFDSAIVPSQVRSEGQVMYIRDKFMRGGRNMLSTFDASEGTLYLIFVATLLAHQQTPEIFALDNVDGTLNPKLVRKLSKHVIDVILDTKNTSKQQVFMTSHHPSSLDSFDIFDQSQKIFVCHRDSRKEGSVSGQTIIEALSPPPGFSKDDWIIAHKGRNLSELMLNERIPGAL